MGFFDLTGKNTQQKMMPKLLRTTTSRFILGKTWNSFLCTANSVSNRLTPEIYPDILPSHLIHSLIHSTEYIFIKTILGTRVTLKVV